MEIFLTTVKYAVYFFGFTAIILTILPLLRFWAWWIRIGEFPRLQIAVVGVAVIAAALFALPPFDVFEDVFLLVLAVCIGYQFYCIVKYLPIYPKQVEISRVPLPQNIIRLFIYNVFIENRETEKFLKMVQKMNPDIVLLAEPDKQWLDEIAEIKKTFPHFVECPLDNAYGMALYSKLELENARLEFLIEDDIPSIHADVVLRSGKRVDLYCLHPRPPVPMESLRSMERDAELLMVGRHINKQDAPTIVCGDLNDVAWSWTTTLFQKVSGLLDPRIGRGLYSTFPVKYPLVRCPLDHVFHSNHFRLVELKRLPNIGSDHFPMYISLALETTAPLMQEEPVADESDHKEAEEMIEEALETLEEERREAEQNEPETA
ncbi:MAG TPA: endonuclease/exonuclease/phosphatase family protein [Pyrinomonadaceae bacterium]|nr:endonuclease/exonuclease/phosphatase family protein [Pyrinomonadaceae bacterium]